jgi:RNA polymerase sigma factor (sigma-70 family)
MPSPVSVTQQLQGWIDRLRAGDETARKHLIDCACERLTRLTRKMLKGYPRVKRWEQTDDVLQNAIVRLYRSLGEVQPETVTDFLRLGALNIRRELLDLARRYYGPRGLGAHHASVHKQGDDSSAPTPLDNAPGTEDPQQLALWTEFHQRIDELPDEDREVFDLLWYQGLSQAEAAEALGISERTVKRRWQSARLRLHQTLGSAPPG